MTTDFIIMITLLYLAIRGWFQGFRWSLYDLVKFIGAFFGTRFLMEKSLPLVENSNWYHGYALNVNHFFRQHLPGWIFQWQNLRPDRALTAVFLFFLLMMLLRTIILGLWSRENPADRYLGLIFGAAKGILYIMILTALLRPILPHILSEGALADMGKSNILLVIAQYNFFLNLWGSL